jgi:hypothetical protein
MYLATPAGFEIESRDFPKTKRDATFNEPNEAGGGSTAQAQTDLNMYLEACVNAIRGTAGVNATRIIVIQPVGASPVQSGIQSMMKTSIIDDPHLLISLHTYYPTNFGLSETPVRLGKQRRLHQHAEFHRQADPGLVAHAAHRHR